MENFIRVVSHKELTGCDCPNNAGIKLNSPITGHTCKVCGASKDKYTELKADYATIAASHRRLVEAVRGYFDTIWDDNSERLTVREEFQAALAEAEQLSKEVNG